MPHTRSEPEVHSRRVSLHIGASPEAAWKNVVRHWLERIASRTLRAKKPAAVVTASRCQAYFFRSRLLAEGKSLIAVKFLSPLQLRELLLRGGDQHVPLREHLRLILAVTAEEFASKSTDDETALVAKSIARDADRFLRALDELRAAGWTFDEIESPALLEIAARFEKRVRECGFTFVHDADRAALAHGQPLFSKLLLFGFRSDETALVAKSIARDADRFLRALDELRAAGWTFDEIESPALLEIAARFEKRVRECGFTFVHDADRAALAHGQPLFSKLLLFGFDAAHWPL